MGESFEETVRREAKEESGLTLGELNLFKLISGRDRIIEYPNGDVTFGPGIVFLTKEFSGEIVNDPEEVMEHAVLYLHIYFCGMPVIMLYNFGSAILRSRGDSRRPFLCLRTQTVS